MRRIFALWIIAVFMMHASGASAQPSASTQTWRDARDYWLGCLVAGGTIGHSHNSGQGAANYSYGYDANCEYSGWVVDHEAALHIAAYPGATVYGCRFIGTDGYGGSTDYHASWYYGGGWTNPCGSTYYATSSNHYLSYNGSTVSLMYIGLGTGWIAWD